MKNKNLWIVFITSVITYLLGRFIHPISSLHGLSEGIKAIAITGLSIGVLAWIADCAHVFKKHKNENT